MLFDIYTLFIFLETSFISIINLFDAWQLQMHGITFSILDFALMLIVVYETWVFLFEILGMEG